MIVPNEAMAPLLRKGEDADVDPDDVEVEDTCVYALRVKGYSEPLLAMARKRSGGGFRYGTLRPIGEGGEPMIDEERVLQILGRVVYHGEAMIKPSTMLKPKRTG